MVRRSESKFFSDWPLSGRCPGNHEGSAAAAPAAQTEP